MDKDDWCGYASPPCAAHQLEAPCSDNGRAPVPATLNELLEGERAGARILRETHDCNVAELDRLLAGS